MLTAEKINIYKYYKGDVDSFGRGQSIHKRKMSEEDFSLIQNLVSRYIIVRNNLASDEFKNTIELEIKNICDSAETIAELKSLQM